jgi:hypothetical protein
MRQALLLPFTHFVAAFQRAVPDPPWLGLGALLAGITASWWIYVPVHELAHALGCIVTGGTVERLEIDAKYGATLLQRVFPFVVVGSSYAGQLTGFDTGGNDLVFLATDFAPFLLTIAAGVPLLVRIGRRGSASLPRSFLLGVALPVAYAPFTNLPGDYYEMGSIVVTRGTAFAVPGFDVERWRGDDLFALARELGGGGPPRAGDLAGLAAGSILALALAFGTYLAGALVAQALTPRPRHGAPADDP